VPGPARTFIFLEIVTVGDWEVGVGVAVGGRVGDGVGVTVGVAVASRTASRSSYEASRSDIVAISSTMASTFVARPSRVNPAS